jgi:hypothetical protein
MIVIKFPPTYEDRLSLMFREYKRNTQFFEYNFIDTPQGIDNNYAVWVIKLKHNKQINDVLILLKDSKDILGLTDLEFSYAHNDKELYSQTTSDSMRMIQWFKV